MTLASNRDCGRPMTSVDIAEIPFSSLRKDSVPATSREATGCHYLKETSSPFFLQSGDRS
jgi:hypothetical protein